MISIEENFPKTRKEARMLNMKFYFTWKPCINGHLCKRKVINGNCYECAKKVMHNNRIKNIVTRKEKAKIYYIETRDEMREIRKQRSNNYYKNNKEKRLAIAKVWSEKNKSRHKELNKKWYINNKEHVKKRGAAWEKNNPEKSSLRRGRRRALEAGIEGTHRLEDLKNIKKMQKNKCAYCKSKLKHNSHLDHILPVAKGGTNWPSNLQYLCPSCNLRKKDKLQEDFMRENGLLL